MSNAVAVARTGRHHQRYENGYRLVAGCIPYKRKSSVGQTCSLEDRWEVLMVSTPDREDLVFPKGGWEDDETVEEAACREALEEAGVKGVIDNELGTWEFKSKRNQNCSGLEGICRGYMFTMRVTEEFKSWPEEATHGRHWLTVKKALERCRYPWMREALEKSLRVLSKEFQAQPKEVPTASSRYSVRFQSCSVEPPTANAPIEPVNAMTDQISSGLNERPLRLQGCLIVESATVTASTTPVNALC